MVVSLSLAACTDPHGQNGSGGGGGGGSTSTSSTSTDTMGTTTDTMGTTTSSTTTSLPPGETVTIEMDSFDIGPGEEVYKCQNFKNPFGKDVDVKAFESHMTKGSHHLLLFYKSNVAANGALEDCSGLEFAATPYSTQLPDDSSVFPDGIAAGIPATKGFRLQSHYLNTSADKITAHVQVTFHLAEPGTVTDHAGVMFIVQPSIDIPPNSTQDVTYDCAIPRDMKILKTSSHMHKHGTKFTSTVAGATFYETSTWDEPQPALFSPAKDLKKGDPLHFACTFVNNSPDTLTFGESAQSNEMCILVASFYPTTVNQPTITCQ